MNNKTINIDISRKCFSILILISVNLNQAIKCCAIVDSYLNITENDNEFKKNELYIEMINCTYRDLLMCISRIYDKSKGNSSNINEFKKLMNQDTKTSFSKEEKSTINSKIKPLQKEYKSLYEKDRNRRLAHTDYSNFYNINKNMYTYTQIKEFVLKTKAVFEYILSINKDFIFLENINKLINKYSLLFKNR